MSSKMSLYDAIRDNNVKKVKAIIRKNKQALHTNRDFGSPLLVAAESGYTELVKLFLKSGLDPNVQDVNGCTPLISACHFNHYDSAVLLLQHNADPNLQCTLGNTGLHAAARNDNVKMLQTLIQHGADCDVTNIDGWTALHRGVSLNRARAVKYLLETGADVSIKSKLGRSPCEMALRMNFYDLANMLRKYEEKRQREERVHNNSEGGGCPSTETENTDNNNNIITRTSSNLQTRFVEMKSFAMKLFNPQKTNKTDSYDLGESPTINSQRAHSSKAGLNMTEIIDDDDSDESGDDEGIKNECPICFEIPLPPTHIYQCTNGHIYCGECKVKPSMRTCPQCGIDISMMENRNRYAENNIAELYKKKRLEEK